MRRVTISEKCDPLAVEADVQVYNNGRE